MAGNSTNDSGLAARADLTARLCLTALCTGAEQPQREGAMVRAMVRATFVRTASPLATAVAMTTTATARAFAAPTVRRINQAPSPDSDIGVHVDLGRFVLDASRQRADGKADRKAGDRLEYAGEFHGCLVVRCGVFRPPLPLTTDACAEPSRCFKSCPVRTCRSTASSDQPAAFRGTPTHDKSRTRLRRSNWRWRCPKPSGPPECDRFFRRR